MHIGFPNRKDEDTILSAAYIKGKYYIDVPNMKVEDYSQRAWRHVDKGAMNKYGFYGEQLERGQILKFGRYVFRINEISTDTEDNKIDTEMDHIHTHRSNREDLESTQKVLFTDKRRASEDVGLHKQLIKMKRMNTISEEHSKDVVCRICLSEDSHDPDDPLISP